MAEKLSKRHEDAVIGYAESLAEFGNAVGLQLLPNTPAIELVGDTTIVRFQAEHEVRVRFAKLVFDEFQRAHELTGGSGLLCLRWVTILPGP